MNIKVTVIGSGYGGIASASLLQKSGFDVTILESHSAIGGCASYFKRKNFVFDVGATTFSGLKNGLPVNLFLKQIGIQPEFKKLDPGMIIYLNDKKIIRYSNLNSWIHEAENHFGENQREFWEKVYKIEDKSWKFILKEKNLPPDQFLKWIKLGNPFNLRYLDLLPNLFIPVSNIIKNYKINNPDFIKFIDEQLLITTQSRSNESPFITSCLGLAYPSDTYYPYGGMYKTAELAKTEFERLGGKIKFKSEAISLEKNTNIYNIITNKSEKFESNILISNIPIWNLEKITTGKIKKWIQKYTNKFSESSGAFTLNFAIPEIKLETAYYQIHTRTKIPFCSASAFFVSFSLPDDRLRAPEGFLTVTISTHTDPIHWLEISKDIYEKKKSIVTNFILEKFEEVFGKTDKFFSLSGTPHTFERYTKREKGFVGGISHSVKKSILGFPPNITPFHGLYLATDTAFPGQGIPAVILSALRIKDHVIENFH